MRVLLVIFLGFLSLSLPGQAATFGLFTYTDHGTYISIDDYPTDAAGAVVIPDTIDGKPVTTIASAAFYRCSLITDVTIPSSVTSIGTYAFDSCSSLNSITIPDSVLVLGSYAFRDCHSATTLQIGNSVPTLELSAFEDCTSLISVTIPGSVGTIRSNAFRGCTSLEAVTMANSVTSIESYAFRDCRSLAAISIPDSVNTLGIGIFYDCRSLSDVSIGNSAPEISNSMFSRCYELANVSIGSSVANIGSSAFSSCSSLTAISLPDSVTSIGNGAFSGCSSLTGISISAFVTSIGSSPFSGCVAMTAVNVDAANPAYSSISGVLFDKNQTLLMYCPGSYVGHFEIPATTTVIEDYAFRSCGGLTSVTIPNSVEEIRFRAFEDCSSLTSITIPDSVTLIENYAFEDCFSLTTVNIGSGASGISAYTFDGCVAIESLTVSASNTNHQSIDGVLYNADISSLLMYPARKAGTSHAIPGTVTSIGDYAFFGCSLLEEITIPPACSAIGKHAFDGCASLTGIIIPDLVGSIGDYTFNNCTSLASVSIGSSVSSIGRDAFAYCSSLTSVVIPDSVLSISNYTFRSCYSLTSVTLGNSVTTLGTSFFYCKSLTDLFIPASVASINVVGFNGCASLDSIDVDPANPSFSSVDGVLYNKDGSTLLKYPPHKAGALVIPGSVTTIGSSAFNLTNRLTSVTIPASITSMPTRPFYTSSELQSITVDPANPNYSSTEGVLYDKAQTLVIKCPQGFSGVHTIPGTAAQIEYNAFLECRLLTGINIPDSMTGIRSASFEKCTSLTSVTLPNTLTSIGRFAFRDCTSLTSISIPASVTFFDYECFIGCVNLTSVTLPSTLPNYGGRMFADCPKLTQLTLPDAKTTLFNKEFSFCTELTTLNLSASLDKIEPNAFTNCPKLATFTINPANTHFTISDGIIYSFDMSTLVRVPPAHSGTVNIPASVTTIQDGAFDGCASITDFSVDAGNTSLESVGGVLFSEDLSRLIRCPATYNGSYSVGASVTTIDAGAFQLCLGIPSINVDAANPNYNSTNGCLFTKDLSTLIRCPAGYSGNFQLPAGTTALHSDAFDDCTSMTSISVEGGNPTYSSFGGVLYNLSQSEIIKCPAGFSGIHAPPASTRSIGGSAFLACASLTGITLPDSLDLIDGSAFRRCTGLTSIIIPESVSRISWWAFFNCDNLTDITFKGHAPLVNGYGNFFSVTSGDPTIHHFNDSAGFTSVNWIGYPVNDMGEASGLKKWLIDEDFAYDQDPDTDLNGDGVALLTAYALNLDPRTNLASSMPSAMINGTDLDMEFYSAAEGITYTVECSDDLAIWTTAGVDLSPIDPEGMRTASLPIGPGKRFMRLTMAETP